MNNSTIGWYIESQNKLYVPLETKWTKNNMSTMEQLRSILMARGLIDLRPLGNTSGQVLENASFRKIFPVQMKVADALKKEIPIEEVPMTAIDLERLQKIVEPKEKNGGFFKKQ